MVNNWTMTYNQEAGAKEGNFLISNIISGIKEDQTMGTIKFKIREDVKPTTTVIKFKDVKSNDGKNLVNETDKSIIIKIIEDEEKKNPQDSSTNTNTIIKPITTTKENTININIQNESTSPNTLPQTGNNITPVVIGVIGIIIAIVIRIKYKKIDQ